MRKYAAGVVALAALLAYGATSFAQSTPSAATSATTITGTLTLRQGPISFECRGGDRPRHPRGCRFTNVGTWQSSTGVGGVFVNRDVVTGHPPPNTYTFHATDKFYADAGTFTSVDSGK